MLISRVSHRSEAKCALAPAERAAIHFAREDECGGMRMRVPGCRDGVPPFSCRSSPCRVLPRKMSEGLEEGRPLECSLLHTQSSAAAPSRVFQRSLHGFARARTPKASARGLASNRSMTIVDVRLGGNALWQPRSPLASPRTSASVSVRGLGSRGVLSLLCMYRLSISRKALRVAADGDHRPARRLQHRVPCIRPLRREQRNRLLARHRAQ